MLVAEDVINEAIRVFKASEAIDHPHRGKERVDAEELLTFVVGREPDPDDEISASEAARFRRLVARRVAGAPVAYVTRTITFCDLELEVGPGAFIPRQSTEFMAAQALRRLRGRRSPVFVDVATGVGPVALAVAANLRRSRVFGVDLSPRALAMARRSAQRLKLRNVQFLRGDLFAPVPAELAGTVDVITLHPPYVRRREVSALPDEIARFEPEESLTDYSPQGDRIVRRVAEEAPTWLRRGGWLLLEVSPDRSRHMASILRRAGFQDVRSTRGGLVQVTRVIVGRT